MIRRRLIPSAAILIVGDYVGEGPTAIEPCENERVSISFVSLRDFIEEFG